MYVLPWATPAPIGLVLGTGMGILAFVLAAVLIVVDFLIYLPFCKAYDAVLVEKEAQKAEVIATEEGASADVREEVPVAASQVISDANKEINVLVLCAGAGTSTMLANALKKVHLNRKHRSVQWRVLMVLITKCCRILIWWS